MATQAEVIAPGTMVAGKYRVEGQRGSGGMALVLEATQLGSGKRVALKVLKSTALKSAEAVARFEREVGVMSRLANEHVARVVDSGTTSDGSPYLAMELLDGHDLEAEITMRGRFPPEEAVRLLLEACEGVAEAHRMGLVHRDLKPGNLFLAKRADGTLAVKVLDFGLSKVTGGHVPLTNTAVNVGTPLYMAPEQIANSRDVEARSDQHALGAILCTLLTGKPPYQGESLTELAVAISVQAPPAIAAQVGAPPGLEAVIHRALGKKPTDRYADVAELAEALAPFAGEAGARMAMRVRMVLAGRDPDPHPRAMTLPIGVDAGRISALPGSVAAGARTSPTGPASAPMLPPAAPLPPGSDPRLAIPQAPPVMQETRPGSDLARYYPFLGLTFVATVGMLVGAYFVYTSGHDKKPAASAEPTASVAAKAATAAPPASSPAAPPSAAPPAATASEAAPPVDSAPPPPPPEPSEAVSQAPPKPPPRRPFRPKPKPSVKPSAKPPPRAPVPPPKRR